MQVKVTLESDIGLGYVIFFVALAGHRRGFENSRVELFGCLGEVKELVLQIQLSLIDSEGDGLGGVCVYSQPVASTLLIDSLLIKAVRDKGSLIQKHKQEFVFEELGDLRVVLAARSLALL